VTKTAERATRIVVLRPALPFNSYFSFLPLPFLHFYFFGLVPFPFRLFVLLTPLFACHLTRACFSSWGVSRHINYLGEIIQGAAICSMCFLSTGEETSCRKKKEKEKEKKTPDR
jgi:hypothetical protein